MKKIIILFIILFSFNLNAQKIKVKKGKVLIDGVAVATVKALGSTYTFTSLNNKNTIITKSHRLQITKELEKKWLTIYDAEEKRFSEVEMEYFSVTLNGKKSVAELLIKKYALITTNGVENIESFLDKERPSLTEEYNGLIKKEVVKNSELKNLNLTVNPNAKNIAEKGNIIGTYKAVQNKGPQNGQIYTIYDLDFNKVAIASPGSMGKISVSLPYAKNKFLFKAKTSIAQKTSIYNEGKLVTEIIEQMYLNNVTLGHQVNLQKKIDADTKKEQVRDFKKTEKEILEKQSVNIYKEHGYIITKEGVKTEGVISIMFEDLYNKVGKNITEYKGKASTVTFINDNTSKSKIYSSKKNNVDFCIDKDNKCFKALKGFLGKTYYEVIDESENSNLFLYKKSGTSIMKIIKKGDVDGYTFITLFKKKNIKKLNQYLNCSEITDDLSQFKYNKIEDVKELIKLYNTTCK